MKNKICIYAMCKNESQFVERWLESVKEADYIVVLDTGSSDDTYDKFVKYAISHEYTPNSKLIVDRKVITPWRFDAGRNESLKLAYDIPDANIFFSLDLDEIIEPGWGDVLRKNWVEGRHSRCCYKYTWSHTANGAEGRSFRQDKIHSREWKWIYPVHELLVRNDDSRYMYTECLDIFDELHVQHYPDDTKSRSSYLPLLEKRYEEYPDDLMTQMYLGHEYYYRGFYEKSIDMLSKVLTRLEPKGIDAASCYLFIGDCYVKLDNKMEAVSSYYKSMLTDRTYIEPYVALGRLYLDNKDYDMVINIVTKGIRNSVRKYSWLERDKSWSYEPWDLLSLACFYSGKKKESLAYAVKAYSFDKDDKRLLDNINQILVHSTNEDLL